MVWFLKTITSLIAAYLVATGQTPPRSARLAAPVAGNLQIVGKLSCSDGRSPIGMRISAIPVVAKGVTLPVRTATADISGQFLIKNLESATYRLSVDTLDRPYLTPTPITYGANAFSKSEKVSINLQHGPAITVRIRDVETGLPISGARVDITGTSSQTDGGQVTVVRGSLNFRLEVFSNLQVPANQGARPNFEPRLAVLPGVSLVRQIKLPRPCNVTWEVSAKGDPSAPASSKTIRGVVVDENNRPVAGATISVRRFRDVSTAVSDAQGRFQVASYRICNLGDDRFNVHLIAEKGNLVARKDPTAVETRSPIRLTLARNRSVGFTGRLVDRNGNPLEGCAVYVFQIGPSSTAENTGRTYAGASGHDGKFEISDLDAAFAYRLAYGSYDRNAGYGRSYRPFDPNSGKSFNQIPGRSMDLGTVRVEHPTRTVTGQLVDVKGRALPRDLIVRMVRVSPSPLGETLDGNRVSPSVDSSVDSRGRFRFDDVTDLDYNLVVYVGTNGVYRTGAGSRDALYVRKLNLNESNVRLVINLRNPEP